MLVYTGTKYDFINVDGKIMVDIENYKKFNPLCMFYNDMNKIVNVCSEDDLLIFVPLVPIYSFENKCWGLIDVDHIVDADFNEQNYNYLTMDERRKNVILSITRNSYKNTMIDLVTNEKLGCIILLQGSSGTGKTSTTRLVSEKIRAPMYIATSGELGTSAKEIEKSLENIFKLVCSWKAIFLLDEADIFLERRDNTDTHRNSVVGIFLRMLDKFSGVMFLTTNRIDAIDPAFNSRISIQFDYDNLTEKQREEIWRRNLENNNVVFDDSIIKELSIKNMNGRQIKNIVKLASSLSINEEISTSVDDFRVIFAVGNYKEQFVETK